jgi:hypothetical protein
VTKGKSKVEGVIMKKKVKAHIKGTFREAIATIVIDENNNIEEIIDIEDISDLEDCEVKTIID